MLEHLAFLVFGLILLVKGSDFFVDAATRIAGKMGVSEFVIGLTLVAIGTSIPELASSLVAAIEGYPGIILGNIIGSNIANIGLILGISISLNAIKTDKDVLKRDGYIMLAVAILFYILAFDGVISLIEGVIFLLVYSAYVMFLIKSREQLETYHFKQFIKYFIQSEYLLTIKDKVIREALKARKLESLSSYQQKVFASFKEGLIKDGLIICLSIIAIAYGANYLVDEAVWFSDLFQVPRALIGLSVIAIGTSLPELSVSISAAKKGFGNIMMGNVIGSNITNILLILGLSILINPLTVGKTTLIYAAPFMLWMSLLLLLFISTDEVISRWEGFILLSMYLAFMVFVFVNGIF